MSRRNVAVPEAIEFMALMIRYATVVHTGQPCTNAHALLPGRDEVTFWSLAGGRPWALASRKMFIKS